jgi:hypothetical protein
MCFQQSINGTGSGVEERRGREGVFLKDQQTERERGWDGMGWDEIQLFSEW